MASSHTYSLPNWHGRGGSTACSVGSRALVFGGADRMGNLFGDLVSLDDPPRGASRVISAGGGGGAPPIGGHAAAGMCVGWTWQPCVRDDGVAAEATVGGPLAAAAVGGAHALVVFGGINFAEETAYGGLWEWADGDGDAGVWRCLTDDVAERARGRGVPRGRTGHSLSSVPPPVVLAAAPPAGGDGGASLDDELLGTRLPPVALSSVPGACADAALAVLFGGSTPSDGPLNDAWILRVSDSRSGVVDAGAAGGGAAAARMYEWESLPSSGGGGAAPPAPRELHAAFVRPAIVRLAAPLPAGALTPADDALVHVLAPPALVVHGGRCADGTPRVDLCVLDLLARVWLPQVRSPHARCAAASAASPDGFRLFEFGGQASMEALSAALVELDTSGADLLAEGMEADEAVGLRPAEWTWRARPLAALRPARFAAAAVAFPRGAHACDLLVIGGMTAGEDLAEVLVVKLADLGSGNYC